MCRVPLSAKYQRSISGSALNQLKFLSEIGVTDRIHCSELVPADFLQLVFNLGHWEWIPPYDFEFHMSSVLAGIVKPFPF
jgi:hypothetical protein